MVIPTRNLHHKHAALDHDKVLFHFENAEYFFVYNNFGMLTSSYWFAHCIFASARGDVCLKSFSNKVYLEYWGDWKRRETCLQEVISQFITIFHSQGVLLVISFHVWSKKWIQFHSTFLLTMFLVNLRSVLLQFLHLNRYLISLTKRTSLVCSIYSSVFSI